ncbi:MAG: sigma-70 family RNA polymerase sigma factor, partial [Actinobacteria bacterium]|nr:sigma-70 family RNA polymerase sigma factor [Actinomycetota bacterium]
MPGGDAGLIEAFRDGEAAAFRRLRIRHEGAAQVLASKLPGEPPVSSVVAQAFVRVRDAIRGGGGPAEAFRPYLLTTLRRVAAERMHGAGPRARQEAPWPEDAPVLPGEWKPFLDREVAFLARTPMVRAFLSLPEPDQAALWYTDIELAKAAQAAVPLGLTRSGVRALRKQASNRLRQAYLRHYLAGTRTECRQLADRLSAHASGALRTSNAGDVVDHMRECRDCRDAHAELSGLGTSLRGLVAPVFLGAAASAYLQMPSGRLTFPEDSGQAQRPRPPLPLAA